MVGFFSLPAERPPDQGGAVKMLAIGWVICVGILAAVSTEGGRWLAWIFAVMVGHLVGWW